MRDKKLIKTIENTIMLLLSNDLDSTETYKDLQIQLEKLNKESKNARNKRKS